MTEKDSLLLDRGQSLQVTLQSRGAAGLQLRYDIADTSVVAVERKDVDPGDQTAAHSPTVGGAVPAVFEIRGLRPGRTQITFFEIRPWEPTFQRIVQRTLTVTVGEPK